MSPNAARPCPPPLERTTLGASIRTAPPGDPTVTDLIAFAQMLAVVSLAALPIVVLVRLIDSDPGFDDPTTYGKRVEELHPLVLSSLPR